MRNEAVADFTQALKDDADAVALLERTISALTRFYRTNGITMALVSATALQHNYTDDQDQAPVTSWSEPYSGRGTETHGVVAILQMLKEDIEKEMESDREDSAKGQAQFEKEKAAMQKTMDSQVGLKLATEKELVSAEKQLEDVRGVERAKKKDLE